ncbi:MAG: ABC transporter ATP-binding protein [Alphaproteobacteria bacterium]
MLDVAGLSVHYGKIGALHGVSLAVAEREIVALVGANGAGKSSLLNAVAGIVVPSSGRIVWNGTDLTGWPAHRVSRRGIVSVPEGRRIFVQLTIEENLRLGYYAGPQSRPFATARDDMLALFPALADRLGEKGALLSGGEAQMLALARGLIAGPKLLLLDEPSLGLAPIATESIFALIAGLPALGITVLLVEQNVRQALQVAARAYVLEGGRVVLDGAASSLLNHPHLATAYLGTGRTEQRS